MPNSNPTSKHTSPIAYFVRSSGNPALFYRLVPDLYGVLRCECKAATFSRQPCRHVRAVLAGEAIAATPKRMPASASTFRTTRRGAVVMDGLNLPDEGMPRARTSPAGRDMADMLQV